jgi:septal ring factor EnvC (AmiA/AmiB activator)
MRRKGLSVRLERHMERGEELMGLNRAAAERHARAFERLMATFDRHGKAFEQHGRTMEQHERAMEQHGRAMESHEQAFKRHEEVFERVTAALDRHEAQADDLKTFIREMNRRGEKVVQELVRRAAMRSSTPNSLDGPTRSSPR